MGHLPLILSSSFLAVTAAPDFCFGSPHRCLSSAQLPRLHFLQAHCFALPRIGFLSAHLAPASHPYIFLGQNSSPFHPVNSLHPTLLAGLKASTARCFAQRLDAFSCFSALVPPASLLRPTLLCPNFFAQPSLAFSARLFAQAFPHLRLVALLHPPFSAHLCRAPFFALLPPSLLHPPPPPTSAAHPSLLRVFSSPPTLLLPPYPYSSILLSAHPSPTVLLPLLLRLPCSAVHLTAHSSAPNHCSAPPCSARPSSVHACAFPLSLLRPPFSTRRYASTFAPTLLPCFVFCPYLCLRALK
jgi:hypothetical protein